jgi:hypothetical protein
MRSARAARRRRRSMRPASAAALSAPLAVPERVRAPRFAPSIHEKHRLGLSPVHTQAASQLREAEPRLGCEHKGRYHVPPHETLVQQRMIHRSIAKAPGGVLTEHRVKGVKNPSTLELSRFFFKWFRMAPTRWLYLGDAGFNARENRRRHRGWYGPYAERTTPPLQMYCGHGTPNTAKTGILGVRRRRGPDASETNTLSVIYGPFCTHFALAATSLN